MDYKKLSKIADSKVMKTPGWESYDVFDFLTEEEKQDALKLYDINFAVSYDGMPLGYEGPLKPFKYIEAAEYDDGVIPVGFAADYMEDVWCCGRVEVEYTGNIKVSYRKFNLSEEDLEVIAEWHETSIKSIKNEIDKWNSDPKKFIQPIVELCKKSVKDYILEAKKDYLE